MVFKKSKVCCISDIHIGVHQNNALWHDIAINWASWLKKELVKKGIKDIVISGDLFHYRDEIAVNTMQVTTRIMNMWRNFNIILLVGNHDSYYKDRVDVNSLSILSGWDNITVFDRQEQVTAFGKKILFCPWGVRTEELVKSDIIFGHFEIQSFKMNQYKICTDGIKSRDLLKHAPLVITGHFHLRDERKYKTGTILYLGNPFQMDFGDVDSTKGYYILDIKNTDYKFYENNISPEHKKIYLSKLVEYPGITDDVREMFRNNIVKFIIDKHISPDEIDLLLSKFSELDPVSINTDYEINFNKFGIDEQDDISISGIDIPEAIEEFINMLDIEDRASVVRATLDLYNKSK
jgi:DNA repair exonuclease SbcCD nuclease subunit